MRSKSSKVRSTLRIDFARERRALLLRVFFHAFVKKSRKIVKKSRKIVKNCDFRDFREKKTRPRGLVSRAPAKQVRLRLRSTIRSQKSYDTPNRSCGLAFRLPWPIWPGYQNGQNWPNRPERQPGSPGNLKMARGVAGLAPPDLPRRTRRYGKRFQAERRRGLIPLRRAS